MEDNSRKMSILKEPIFELIKAGEKRIHLDGININLTSLRLQVLSRDTPCISCGKNIHYFVYEGENKRKTVRHLNPYHLTEDGVEILMTVDHIHSIAGGGDKYNKENMQIMCQPCNNMKGPCRTVAGGLLIYLTRKIQSNKASYLQTERQIKHLPTDVLKVGKIFCEKVMKVFGRHTRVSERSQRISSVISSILSSRT